MRLQCFENLKSSTIVLFRKVKQTIAGDQTGLRSGNRRCSFRFSAATPAIMTDIFRNLPRSLQTIARTVLRLSHYRLLPNPFPFTTPILPFDAIRSSCWVRHEPTQTESVGENMTGPGIFISERMPHLALDFPRGLQPGMMCETEVGVITGT
jgi:hypothetical protein